MKSILFLFLVFVLWGGAVDAASSSVSGKIAPWVTAHTDKGAVSPFFVVLREQADVSGAYQLATKLEKGNYVYQRLTETARATQADVLRFLKLRRIAYRPYWIVNAILIEKGNRKLVLDLAARNDIDRIEGDPLIHNSFPTEEGNAPQQILTTEWNVNKMNSPSVWALGFNGQSIVVGGQDTGYRWTHNAIKGKYRGWNGVTADHNYNWHDSIHTSVGNPCGNNAVAPCDDYGHGTHTMGTAVGDDGGTNQVGNAPGAKWIGCRDMDQGNGTPSTYLECFQWFLAPTKLDGTGANPALAPDLTTNSWTCPPSEECSANTLQAAVDNQKAAGIMTIVAAGNSGPNCNTVSDPPATYGSSYTVGSTENDADNTVSSFSSRGFVFGSLLMKPNIMGPGRGVFSSFNSNDTSYASMSGTSMATPNVAGAIATVLSGHACYVGRQDNVELLMNTTATRIPATVEGCGGDYIVGPNNTWGYGLANALKAFKSAGPPVGDGWGGHAGGTAAKFSKSGTNITATWDAATCAGTGAVILYGSIGNYGSYTGSADCSAGTSGSKSFAMPSGSVWFNILWSNVPSVASPQGIAGHPGFASSGARTLNPSGFCNLTCSDTTDTTCN